MFFGQLNTPETYETFLQTPALLRALAWIREMPSDQAPGVYEIEGDRIFVNVHGYETLPREQCRFESHRKYIDIQYCLEGGELIDIEWASYLTPDGPFDHEKDLQFYQNQPQPEQQEGGTVLRMTPGDFAIFLPEDAHRPRVGDGRHPSVRKLVVKISRDLLPEGI